MKTTQQTANFCTKTITALLLFILPALSFGQALTGVKTIPGDYSTIKMAIDTLNFNGVGTGGVVFNIAAGTTEIAPTGGYIITATGTASNRIVIRKDPGTTGANPLITAQVGVSTSLDGIFFITGGDYITFDGIDLQESAANTTTTTQMEWGFALLKRSSVTPFDGCQYDTIRNCTITLNRTNAVTKGIYVNNHIMTATTALAITANSDANSYISIINNVIQNTNTGVYLYGYAAASPFSLYDQNCTVSGNRILNFAGASTGYGVYIMNHMNHVISNNVIDNYNNGNSGAIGSTAATYGIYNYYSNTSGVQTNPTMTGNFITITQAGGSSGAFYAMYVYYQFGNVTIMNNSAKLQTLGTTTTTGTIYCFYIYSPTYSCGNLQYRNNHIDSVTINNSTGTLYGHYVYANGTTTDISGNTFTYFTRNLATTGTFYGLYAYNSMNYTIPGTITNIYNNTIDSINNGASTGAIYAAYPLGGGYITNIYNNTISRIYGTASTTFYGLSPYYYATTMNVYNNTVSTIVNNGTLYGMYYYAYYVANGNVYNNTISNLIANGAASSLVGCYVYYGATNSLNIYKNKFYNYLATGTGGCAAQGMLLYMASPSAIANMPIKVYNNLFSDMQAPNSTVGTVCVSGININNSSYQYAAYLYDNTMHLSGNGGANANSACVYVNSSAATNLLRMNNNILINKLTHTGTGIASAYYRNGTSLGTYNSLSNNNLYYAGVPSSKNLYYYDGTNKDSVLATFKSRVSPRDGNSTTENVNFLSTDPADPNYLKIDTTIATAIESGGINIAGITTDYTGSIRAGNAGYVGTGTAPDLGAFEGNYTPIPMVFDSCNTDQVTNAVLINKTNQPVLRMRIYTENVYGPLAVTKFKLNTSGTTSIADISNARVYYTGSAAVFSGGTQFGTVVAAPNGTFYVTGTQTLSSGSNYFWLTYDISPTANISNFVDGRWDSVMIAGINRAPINGDPAGGTPIAQPLSGSYTIGTAPYFTLADAIADLNTKGMTSSVTINVPAGYTEQAPQGGYLLGSTLLNSNLSASSRLSIVKNGTGVNPLLFAYAGVSTTADGFFMIQGCDYVTINGIDLVDTNMVSVTTQMEQGYGLVKLNASAPFDGCQYDTIMNCTVTLKRTNTNSRGLYVNNAIASDATGGLLITSPSDANSYNVLLSDSVLNTNTGIVFAGLPASATPLLYDQYNVVNGCVVLNYAGTAVGYGVWFNNQLNNTVTNNIIDNFNNGNNGAVGATTTLYGIYNNFGNTSSANPSNLTCTNNFIRLTQGSGSSGADYGMYIYYSHGNLTINNNSIKINTTGATVSTGAMYASYIYPSSYSCNNFQFRNNHLDSFTFNNSSGIFYGFYIYGGGTSNDLSGNTISYISRTGATSGSMYGFYGYYNPNYTTAGTVTNWYNNVIDSVSNGASTGSLYLGYMGGGYNLNIYNNSVTRIYAPNASSIYGFYPYYCSVANIYNNTVSDIYGATASLNGMYLNFTTGNTNTSIHNNTITRLTSSGTSGVIGINGYYCGFPSCNIYKNTIGSLTASAAGGFVYGINVLQSYSGAPSTTPIKVYNNIIGNISAPISTANPGVAGITFNYSSYNYFGYAYYNTINLTGALGTNGSSAGIYIQSLTPMIKIANNLVINNTTVSGTGYASAIQRAGTALTTFDLTSNNNMLYAGTPGTYNVIFNNGTNRDQTIAAYKSRVAPAEASSVSENTTFINGTLPSSPNYLQPDSTIASAIESGAMNVTGITDDYTGKIRQGNTGYAGTGTAPDIGAFEGNYTANDILPPVIIYTPVGNTASTGDRTITVNLTDYTGVPFSTISPVIYYKKFAAGSLTMANGTFLSGNAKNGNWSFTIPASVMGGLTLGDSVYYYIAVQDSSANFNLGSAPGGVVGTSVSSISSPPSTLYSYKIVSGLAGTYTVGGASGAFYNLTNPGGAFDVINNSALSGNVTLVVSGDLNESGAITLKKWSETGSGNFRVKIVPDSSVERQIVDTAATPVANSAVITFDGCSRATIDGRYNGSGKYFRIRNRGANGIAILFKNDATHDTVMYSTLECVTTVTATVVWAGTNVTGGRGNDSNVVTYCNIGDTLGAVAPGGASNTGFFSQGTSGMENDANIVSNNNIFNFGYNAVNMNGSGTGNYWTFYGNRLYQTANRTTSSSYYMFYVTQGFGHIFRKNSIGGSAPDRSGSPIINLGNYWYVFYQSSTNIIPNVYDSNTVANFNTPYIYPIFINQGNAIITNNIIGGLQNAWDTITTSSTCYGIMLQYNPIQAATISNNMISNIRYNGGGTGYLNGIQAASYNGTVVISNNIIHDLYSNGIGSLNTYYLDGITLYQNSTGTYSVDNNTVYNIINYATGYACGIHNYYNYGTQSVTRNKIYNIVAASNTAVGIFDYYNTTPTIYANNVISLTNNNGTGMTIGIQDARTNAIQSSYINNSVFIGGTAGSSSAVNSYGFYRSTGTGVIDVRNNIFYNKRTGGSGSNYAAGYTSTNLISPASVNYNLMVVGDTSRVIELPSSTPTGVAEFNASYAGSYNSNWMASTASVPAQTLFTDTATANLSIVTTNANSWYANGKGITVAAVTNDYAGNARSTSIANGATDIGAFEFTTSTTPPSATASAAPALNSTTNYTFAGHTVASLTWGSTGTVPSTVDVKYYTGNSAPALLPSRTQYNSYYAVTPTGGTGYTYSIALNYDSSMFGNVTSTGASRMARYKSPDWNLVVTSAANASGGMLSSGASMAATTLPANFTGTDNTNALPVTLADFNANKINRDVLVNWFTSSEINSNIFEVERSFDENSFEFIGAVSASGNSSKVTSYNFNDAGVVAITKSDVIYYRLKMIDKDGSFGYSKTVAVKINHDQIENHMVVYPNPISNNLNIDVIAVSAGSAIVTLSDITGRKLMCFNRDVKEGMNNINTDQAASLQTGIYFISVELNGNRQVMKLVKE